MSIINEFREGSSLAKRPEPRRLNVDASGIRAVDLNQQVAPVQLAAPIEPQGLRNSVTEELDTEAMNNIAEVNARPVQGLVAPVLFEGPPPMDDLWERYKQAFLEPAKPSRFDEFEELMPFASRRDPLRSPFEDNQVAGLVADNDPRRILGDEFNPIEGRWGQMGEGGFGALLYGVNLLGAVGAEVMGVVADSALDFVDDWRGFFQRGGVSGADRLVNRARRGLNGSIVWQALLGRDASVSGIGQMLSGTDVADGYERVFGPNILDQQATDILSGVGRAQWGLPQDQYLQEISLYAQNEEAFRAARMEAGAEVYRERGGFTGVLRPLNFLNNSPQLEEAVQRRAYDKLRSNGTLGDDFTFERYRRLNTITTRERTVRLAGDFAMPDPADLGKVLTRGSLALTRGLPSVNRALRTNLRTGEVMDVVLSNGGRQLFDDVIFVSPRARQAAQRTARAALPTARLTPGQDRIEPGPIITPPSSVQVYEPRTPVPQNGVLITPPPNSDAPVQLAIEGTSQRFALPPATEVATPEVDVTFPTTVDELPELDLSNLFSDVSVEELADELADVSLTAEDVAPGVGLLGTSDSGTEARDFVVAAATDAASAPDVNKLITDTADGNTVGALSYHTEIPGVAYVRNLGSTQSGGGRRMMEQLYTEVLANPELDRVRLNSMADARGFYERMGMRSVYDGTSPTYEINTDGIREYMRTTSGTPDATSTTDSLAATEYLGLPADLAGNANISLDQNGNVVKTGQVRSASTGNRETDNLRKVNELGLGPALIDEGTISSTGSGSYTMERIDGTPLREFEGPPESVAESILSDLEVMWKNNITHNDLHTDNIIVRPDGSTTIIDWGPAEFDGYRLEEVLVLNELDGINLQPNYSLGVDEFVADIRGQIRGEPPASSEVFSVGDSVLTPSGVGNVIEIDGSRLTVSFSGPDADDFRRWVEDVYKPRTRERKRFNPSIEFDDFNDRVSQARRLGAQGNNDTLVLLDGVRRAGSREGFTVELQRSQVSAPPVDFEADELVNTPFGVGYIVDAVYDESSDTLNWRVRLDTPDTRDFSNWVHSTYRPRTNNPPAIRAELNRMRTPDLALLATQIGVADADSMSKSRLIRELKGKVGRNQIPVDLRSNKQHNASELFDDFSERVAQARRIGVDGSSDTDVLLRAVMASDSYDGFVRTFSEAELSRTSERLPELSQLTLDDGSVVQPQLMRQSVDTDVPIPSSPYSPGALPDALRRRVIGQAVETPSNIVSRIGTGDDLIAKANAMSLVPRADGRPIVPPTREYVADFTLRTGVRHPFADQAVESLTDALNARVDDDDLNFMARFIDDHLGQFTDLEAFERGGVVPIDLGNGATVGIQTRGSSASPPEFTLENVQQVALEVATRNPEYVFGSGRVFIGPVLDAMGISKQEFAERHFVDLFRQGVFARADLAHTLDQSLVGASELSVPTNTNTVHFIRLPQEVDGTAQYFNLGEGAAKVKSEADRIRRERVVSNRVEANRVQSVQLGKERAEYQRLTETPGVYDSDEAVEYIADAEAAFNDAAIELDRLNEQMADELVELYDDIPDDAILDELYDDQAFTRWVETNNSGRFC